MIEFDKDAIKAAAAAQTETVVMSSNVAPIRPLEPGQQTFEQKVDDLLRRFVFHNQARQLVAPHWRVRDVISVGGLVFIGGQSGAGKSFVVLELARCLMTGAAFFGRKVDKPCAVVLFAPEGQETIDARLGALTRTHGITADMPFAYLGECPDLTKPENRMLVAATLRRVNAHFQQHFGIELGAVFVDTVAAAMDIEDQNNNSEVTKHIKGLKQLARDVGPEVTFIGSHHYGKTVDSGLTGGHAWKANADQVVSVLADKDQVTGEIEGLRTLSLSKNRNGPEGDIGPFDLSYVPLGHREDGDEWGSMVLLPQMDQASTIRGKKVAAPNRGLATLRDAVHEALTINGRPVRIAKGQGPQVTAVQLSPFVRDLFFAKYPTGEDDPSKSAEANEEAKYQARKRAYSRALDKLDSAFSVEEIGGVQWIWTTKKIRSMPSGDNGDMGDNT